LAKREDGVGEFWWFGWIGGGRDLHVGGVNREPVERLFSCLTNSGGLRFAGDLQGVLKGALR
jgi:hypothetical protein